MRQDMAMVVDTVTRRSRQVSELMRAPRTLRVSARQQALRLAAQMRQDRLKAVAVSEVQPHLPARTRFPADKLADEFGSLAGLAAAEVSKIRSVPGVGPKSAEAISRAAKLLAREVEGTVMIQLSDMPRTTQARDLVATLAAIRYADEVLPSAVKDLRRWPSSRVQPLLHTARQYRWWSPSRRRSATAAVDQLQRLLATPDAEAAEREVNIHGGAATPAGWRRRAWQEFDRNPGAFTSLLACVGGSVCAGNSRASQGHLPDALREKVLSTQVDTTLLRATLTPYQVFGTKFLLNQQRAILGDEMGLGKTLQALATAAHVAATSERARVLVVAPAAVLYNWLSEINQHTRMRGYLLHGPDRDTALMQWRRGGGIAVTSFGTLGMLNTPGIDLAIVDEAHYAKNPASIRARVTARVIARSQRAVLLTGTAMENRVDEFTTLVSYLGRGMDPAWLRRQAQVSPTSFRTAVAPAYLRRNQAEVLTELPERIESTLWVEMTDADWAVYQQATDDMARRRWTFGQAKRKAVREIVDKAEAAGRKVLLFSFFRSVLVEIQKGLGDRVSGVVTGEVSPRKRQQIVDEFSNEKNSSVLLAQIGAGGTGLNIQAASVVVLVEPQWTPTIEEQAIARALRRGQRQSVLVYRLLAVGTRDVEVYQRRQHKAAEFDQFARRSAAAEADPAAVETDPSHLTSVM